MKEIIDDVEIIERYLILLLGVVNRPIPSPLHMQKELFLLSKANPKISEFVYFDKHYKGPYSADLDDVSKDPAYYSDAFKFERSNKLSLMPVGKKIYKKIINENSDNPRFREFLNMIKMIREMYDKLTKNELLFLVYATYGEYTKKSDISDKLLSKASRSKFAKQLFDKGLISKKRVKELVG